MRKVTNIEWFEVKETFQRVMAEGWPSQLNLAASFNRRLRNRPDVADSFTGASLNQINGYLDHGYDVTDTKVEAPAIEPRRRRRARWSEDEGDVDIARLYCGSDDFYLTRGFKDSKPGISVDVLMNFSAFVGHEVITEYGRWVAGLLSGLESDGYDLEVAVVCRISKAYESRRDGTRDIRIIVKRPGEVSDFASWSALFAPGGFRSLVFTAIGIDGDRADKTISSSVGSPEGGKGWKVTRDEHRIEIDCKATGGGKVSESLTKSAKEAGVL